MITVFFPLLLSTLQFMHEQICSSARAEMNKKLSAHQVVSVKKMIVSVHHHEKYYLPEIQI